MTTVLKISELIKKLANSGIKVYTGKSGEVRIYVPDPVPPKARPLLAEVRQRKAEVIEYLQWNDHAALALFRAALDRLRQHYPGGCINWAKTNRPEMWQAVISAQNKYDQASDMAGCEQAVAEYERAFNRLIDEYNQLVVQAMEGVKP